MDNDNVEQLVMKLEVYIITMDCQCAGTTIPTLWTNCYKKMSWWKSKQYSIWKWYACFLLFLNGINKDRLKLVLTFVDVLT